LNAESWAFRRRRKSLSSPWFASEEGASTLTKRRAWPTRNRFFIKAKKQPQKTLYILNLLWRRLFAAPAGSLTCNGHFCWIGVYENAHFMQTTLLQNPCASFNCKSWSTKDVPFPRRWRTTPPIKSICAEPNTCVIFLRSQLRLSLLLVVFPSYGFPTTSTTKNFSQNSTTSDDPPPTYFKSISTYSPFNFNHSNTS